MGIYVFKSGRRVDSLLSVSFAGIGTPVQRHAAVHAD